MIMPCSIDQASWYFSQSYIRLLVLLCFVNVYRCYLLVNHSFADKIFHEGWSFRLAFRHETEDVGTTPRIHSTVYECKEVCLVWTHLGFRGSETHLITNLVSSERKSIGYNQFHWFFHVIYWCWSSHIVNQTVRPCTNRALCSCCYHVWCWSVDHKCIPIVVLSGLERLRPT